MTFPCYSCPEQLPNIYNHAHHQKIHATQPNYLFQCGACGIEFHKFRHLCSHISKSHKGARRDSGLQELPGMQCPYCADCPQTVELLVNHLKSEHLQKGTNIMCPLKDCGRTEPLTSISIFSKHLSQHHQGWRGMPLQAARLVQLEPMDTVEDDSGGGYFCDNDVDDDNESTEDRYYEGDSSLDYEEKDILNFIAKFYLKLETQFNIPVENIEQIAASITLLSEMVLSCMKNRLTSELMSQNMARDKVEDTICKLVDSDILFLSHHKNMRGPSFHSEYLRRKLYKANFNFIAPEPCNLSNDPLDTDIYQYVPLRKTLEKFLCDPSVQREIKKSFERFANAGSKSNVYEDYTDGSVMKNRSLPPRRIDLLLFQDAFVTTTMVTTVREKYKTLGVYMTVGNLRSHLRTKLKAMQLLELVLEKEVKRYRQEYFQKLLHDLKDLEVNGILFEGETLPVYLQFFVGDNLGSHFLGGFVESFTNGYVCRFCPIMATEFRANPTLLKPDRTQAQYNCSVMIVENSNRNNHHGVKESSIFNQLANFKVCDPGLPPCLGHDLFHGVVSWDLASMIDHFVEQKWFTYEILNRRITKLFKYSSMDLKNKPAPLKGDGKKLGGNAVQNWTLLRLLPLIIEGRIKDTNDSNWQLYLKLKALCENGVAPAISEEQIDQFGALVQSYLNGRHVLSFKRYKPKHHFLRHYAGLIRKLGPLIHLWGMGFERKHKFFKDVAKRCNNYINILSTMSMRHQLLFTYHCEGERFPEYVSKCKPFQIKPGHFKEDVATLIGRQAFSSNFKAAATIKINNLTYKEGYWLILKQTQPCQIYIGSIEAIILDGKQVYIIHRERMATLNASFGLFEIDEESAGELAIQNFNEIEYPCPQAVYDANNRLCFSLKHTFPPPQA